MSDYHMFIHFSMAFINGLLMSVKMTWDFPVFSFLFPDAEHKSFLPEAR